MISIDPMRSSCMSSSGTAVRLTDTVSLPSSCRLPSTVPSILPVLNTFSRLRITQPLCSPKTSCTVLPIVSASVRLNILRADSLILLIRLAPSSVITPLLMLRRMLSL